ncbi:hypothetical protein DV736_g1866, partial [Chaetothyriales sp. CBS 134916]
MQRQDAPPSDPHSYELSKRAPTSLRSSAVPVHHLPHDTNEAPVDAVALSTNPIAAAWRAVMSRAPLMRGPPAMGSSSYGALAFSPRAGSSTSTASDDSDVEDDVPPYTYVGRRQSDPSMPIALAPAISSSRATSSRLRSRKRSSSLGSEIQMGPDSKTTFGLATAISEDQTESGSSNASTRSRQDRQDYLSPPPLFSDEDPPDNSAYAEVRASVPATDNVAASINTPRMWILSMLFATVGSATNLFFSLRYPSVAITPVIALVLVHPLGCFWDLCLKRISFSRRLRLWLAQGKWNEKEHACVYISSNVSFGFAFATDVIVEQHKFYKQDVPILYQLLLTISTQVLGYTFAGLSRRFLVRPAAMIWPGTLMSTAMFTTMHKRENKVADGWSISRYRFFVRVWVGAVLWYFLPGLLFPALSYFNVLTWAAPDNVVVSNLFGVVSGLGLFPLTFDWAQIAYIGSPLLTPWWAAANVVAGLILVMWVIAPLLYYSNTLFSAYLPILSSAVFDNTGKPYDVSKVLTPDFLFDKAAYDQYSRVYLPITYVLSYGVQFAGLAALVTHTACWYGHDIWRQSREAFANKDDQKHPFDYIAVSAADSFGPDRTLRRHASNGLDVHNRLMSRYPDAPMTWYLLTCVTMIAIGIFVVEYYPVHLPWYGLILALAITTCLFIPVGIVMAITNQHSSLYLICQLICGVVFPGRPVANMVFVTYCYISSAQGVKFSSDLKLGHYMKIPPRLLFKVQMIATLISSVVQIGVLNWMFANISGICTPYAVNGFNCPLARVHFNGSILWGVVGPQRFFGQGALYRPLVWAFLIGFIAPIIVWLIGRKSRKDSIWRKINLPVLFGSLSWIPPATGLNFSGWAVICFTFNSLIRRRASAWWAKYTMTIWSWMDNFHWWGTDVFKNGCDWKACAYLTLKPGDKFGP